LQQVEPIFGGLEVTFGSCEMRFGRIKAGCLKGALFVGNRPMTSVRSSKLMCVNSDSQEEFLGLFAPDKVAFLRGMRREILDISALALVPESGRPSNEIVENYEMDEKDGQADKFTTAGSLGSGHRTICDRQRNVCPPRETLFLCSGHGRVQVAVGGADCVRRGVRAESISK
jgi:hypothetical protein